jgi:hypothetical protein
MISSLRVSILIWADYYPFVFQSCFSLFFWFGFSSFFSRLLICCCCYVSELNFIPDLVIRSSLNTLPGFYLQHECGEILYIDEDIWYSFFCFILIAIQRISRKAECLLLALCYFQSILVIRKSVCLSRGRRVVWSRTQGGWCTCLLQVLTLWGAQ